MDVDQVLAWYGAIVHATTQLARGAAEVTPDAGTRVTQHRDAGVAVVGVYTGHVDKTKPVTIEVLTRPAEAEVFVGRNYRGPSGVKLQDRYGAKMHIECKTDRMKGSLDVVFGGPTPWIADFF